MFDLLGSYDPFIHSSRRVLEFNSVPIIWLQSTSVYVSWRSSHCFLKGSTRFMVLSARTSSILLYYWLLVITLPVKSSCCFDLIFPDESAIWCSKWRPALCRTCEWGSSLSLRSVVQKGMEIVGLLVFLGLIHSLRWSVVVKKRNLCASDRLSDIWRRSLCLNSYSSLSLVVCLTVILCEFKAE